MPKARTVPQGEHASTVHWTSELRVKPEELRRARAAGWLKNGVEGWGVKVDEAKGIVSFTAKPNLVVDVGVQRSLDRLFAIGGPPAAVASMGVDDGAANPVAGTTNSTAGSTNRRIVAFTGAATRAGNVVSAVGTFTQATVAFVMKRLFLTAAAAGTTDAAGDLYSMTNVFTIDLSSFSTWTQTFTATVTGTGS